MKLLSWTFLRFQTLQNLNTFFFLFIAEWGDVISHYVRGLEVGNAGSQVSVEANSLHPQPFLPGSQSNGKSISSVPGILLLEPRIQNK